jgi:hypothetical protein
VSLSESILLCGESGEALEGGCMWYAAVYRRRNVLERVVEWRSD